MQVIKCSLFAFVKHGIKSATAARTNAYWAITSGVQPMLTARLKRMDPIIMDTIKAEKMIPYGTFSSPSVNPVILQLV